MSNPFLAIAVAHDGVSQDRNGQDRIAFEKLVHTLLGYDKIPATLCFYTEGVRWLTGESPFIDELKEIHSRGADIIACRASMADAGLTRELRVGRLEAPDQIDDLLLEAEHTMVV